MKQYRSIEEILKPSTAHMVGDGFRVVNYNPGGQGINKRMSPFFLLDYNVEVNFPATDKPRGVGVHPHRGFETVTIAYKGSVAHHDSAGHSGVIDADDVQWMTAGSGVLHKEYHEKNYAAKGGPFQMVQIWVNLPKKDKMIAPAYQGILHSDKAAVKLDDNGGTVFVIAGSYKGIKGPALTHSPVEMYDIRLNENGEASINLPADYNAGLLVIEGDVIINDERHAPVNNYIQFSNESGEVKIKANKNSKLLLLAGEPINEPVAAYGPFVMNTVEEIQQAIDDVNSGKFGELAA
ncbi:MAG: pirin family protein [Ferruginibacter sp.]